MRKINPTGFKITYQGILAWVPVSKNASVAFGRDGTINSETNGLVSFLLSDRGTFSSPRTIASGKEVVERATAVWIDGNGGGSSAGTPYGFIFVLFISNHLIPGKGETAMVRMAKFDSQGRLSGGWKELLKIKTPPGLYICNQSLGAASKGTSVGVVLSLVYPTYGIESRLQKSAAYFIEISASGGTKIGKTVSLPLPRSGDNDYALAYGPVWNGTRWLIPVSVGLQINDDKSYDVLGNKALVISVTGDTAHKTAAHLIASDTLPYYPTYMDLLLAPYPDSSSDYLLFMKYAHRPSCSFSLNRLNGSGKPIKSKKVAIPALTYKILSDPSYKISGGPFDYWTPIVAHDGTLFVSRLHSIDAANVVAGTHEFEQQFNLYAINARSGAVELKARSYMNLYQNYATRSLMNRFPDGGMAVINNLMQYKDRPHRSYFSRFDVLGSAD